MQTLELDQANRIMQIMESTGQALLDVNTMDEIKSFTQRSTGAARGLPNRPRQRPTTGISTTPSIVTDDSVSVQSSGSGDKGEQPNYIDGPKLSATGHTGLGGNLKRLG